MKFTRSALVVTCSLVAYSAPAYAVRYMTTEEAQKILFPKASSFEASSFNLDQDKISQLKNLSRVRISQSQFAYWNVRRGAIREGFFFVDEVIGKHETITYAVGFSLDQKIMGIEILEYRENYGSEIKDAEWRAQFVGKNSTNELSLGKDIKNISGATLSCLHITEGVRKLSHLMELELGK